MTAAKNYEACRFSKLLVLRRAENSKGDKSRWLCQCDCGNKKEILGELLRLGKTTSCGCARVEMMTGTRRAWKGRGLLSGFRFAHIKACAKSREIPFDLSIDDLWALFERQGGTCALSGRDLSLYGRKGESFGNASLDRINSALGYTLDNVQWVHKDFNYMKQVFSQNDFVSMCQEVVNHFKKEGP